MRRIEAKGHRGVLLLHDIHPATVLALPLLLKELKENGYHIVQAVPAGDRPISVPVLAHAKAEQGGWPRTLPVKNDKAATGHTARASAEAPTRARRVPRLSKFSHADKPGYGGPFRPDAPLQRSHNL
jgi:hypothetical protein